MTIQRVNLPLSAKAGLEQQVNPKTKMKTGIISYGVYIPRFRVKISEIAEFWERLPQPVVNSLRLSEKSVPSIDEDSVTLAVESTSNALNPVSLNPQKIGALIIGSESHPYSVKPSSTIVAEMLGISGNYFAVDTEFACKAGTAAMQIILGLVGSEKIESGIAIGADTAQAKPGDALEYTAASASASFIIGSKNLIAEVIDFSSFSSNTPDFWRRDGQKYPSHGGRFTGQPAYFNHVFNASKNILEKNNLKPADFDYAVFHMPNGKFPREVAKKLGFTKEQLAPGLIVDEIGNPYSASSIVGLAAVLDIAKPNQKIFVCSYGSGAGSDTFIIKTTPKILDFQKKNLKVKTLIKNKSVITYPQFVKWFKSKEFI